MKKKTLFSFHWISSDEMNANNTRSHPIVKVLCTYQEDIVKYREIVVNI